LVYFGALDELFAKVANILKNCSRRSLACATDKNIESFQLPRESNLFAFTIEKTDIYPYELQKTARFAHSVKYIEELAARNNFNLLTKQNVILRRHQNRFIEGYLFIFQI
jgi:predicted TPR repeat methyltransferase